MFFCKMASESDFETFLAQFWFHFGVILEASGRLFGDFLGTFFKVCFLIDFCLAKEHRELQGTSQGGIIGRVYLGKI